MVEPPATVEMGVNTNNISIVESYKKDLKYIDVQLKKAVQNLMNSQHKMHQIDTMLAEKSAELREVKTELVIERAAHERLDEEIRVKTEEQTQLSN